MSTIGHLGRHGLATVLTVAVMGLALALPLALNVLVRNVRDATGDFSEAVGLSVYFKPEVLGTEGTAAGEERRRTRRCRQRDTDHGASRRWRNFVLSRASARRSTRCRTIRCPTC